MLIALGAVVWRRSGRHEPPAVEPALTVPPAPAPPSLRPAPTVPAPDATTPPSVAQGIATMNEKVMMARLREVATTDSAQAIKLAEEGNSRFPDSADAPERESILIHALANAERRSEARGRAEFMVNHYPDSEWVREIEGFTGAHRHRNLSVNDGGDLIYVK